MVKAKLRMVKELEGNEGEIEGSEKNLRVERGWYKLQIPLIVFIRNITIPRQ